MDDDTSGRDPNEGAATPTAAGEPADTGKQQRGRPFQPGQSGNPKGRPKGSRNRVSQAMQVLFEARAEEILNKAIEKALDGDVSMQRALLRTMVPPCREKPIEFDLPAINTPADAVAASSAVVDACAAGDLTLSEARDMMGLITSHVGTIEVAELERRISDL